MDTGAVAGSLFGRERELARIERFLERDARDAARPVLARVHVTSGGNPCFALGLARAPAGRRG